MTVQEDPAAISHISAELRAQGREVTFVPTMGALHDGHLALVEAARKNDAECIVSIFVNPLQFGASEDLDRYPRTLAADLDRLRAAGVRLVFTPTLAGMYPNGPRTTVTPGPLGAELCGATRPVLFGGMLTVVAKLLQITRPHAAYFGEKDYQQLILIQQMVHDLNFDIRIAGVATVREPDGLALSSRNRYLDATERISATAIPAALQAGARVCDRGPAAVLDAARGVLDAAAGVEVEYLELRDPDLDPAPSSGPARLLVAAHVGRTRLIDNISLTLTDLREM
ncbi:pantoate--beta-alanine ligase [Nocardia brasiliensis]|uniref:Pantothenate synthetase n=1 Tax=Nocardia brasiliensis (strain ATCC 700358 / HUJEG-1) TaxID=1133849 RepID=K0F277_NOCB7|nr:pantoate--beta-alanine ligase [Nocardia brasiliensis]AFU01731.1 pantoate--beta-alanine ligase [Nocardia brasiliensis ATCC 700358]OCF89215.1 pantoate--beta-alanine ligase [Nocardia brasiliensis]